MTHRKVRDVMTTDVRTVHVGSPAKTVAGQLEAGSVSALPVVDDDRHVVGVVSEADLLHKITYQDDADDLPRIFRRHRADRAKADGESARTLMTSPAVTIGPGASVVEAAALMERHHVKRLPVVDDTGDLIGIVSRRDLIRMFTRTDDEIRAEVEHEVLDRVLMLEPGTASAWVANGHVTLRGRLRRKSETEIAVALAGRVDGVVGVANSMTFDQDDTTYRALRDDVASRGIYY
ncbi:CBS-domain-containing membrane protein [Cryptosporangium arvum DSM 44712]|uniref:CBS-domain-containing membrane protein n=2 Tax=Cryptosporangium TaxID=65502 RepID=A0A010ZUX6_9ACTN|nr:CBS-domain-containing membrane protein [Cryptosporangium arvum DSM 44712]